MEKYWYFILVVIIAILAIDRVWMMLNCKLRHNPIDTAIKEIKDDIRNIWDFLQKKL